MPGQQQTGSACILAELAEAGNLQSDTVLQAVEMVDVLPHVHSRNML